MNGPFLNQAGRSSCAVGAWHPTCVEHGVGEYGVASTMVDRVIARAATIDIDEAADLYRAHGARLLLSGSGAERAALHEAARVARRVGRTAAYERARRAAARAWRSKLPREQGPWLFVGATIANAAGALVLEDVLEARTFRFLFGPWQQAIGRLVPLGPGASPPFGQTRPTQLRLRTAAPRDSRDHV